MEKTNKTFFIDIDGTIFKHLSNDEIDELIETRGDNSHEGEEVLPNAKEFLTSIAGENMIILTTAREKHHHAHTIKALTYLGIPYDRILFGMRAGPRVVINDIKPIGTAGNRKPLDTAFAMNVKRDSGDYSEYEKIKNLIKSQIGS